MRIDRRALMISTAALLGSAALAPVLAGKSPVYTGLVAGTAVGGYDPVAYFTQGKPVRGSSKFTSNPVREPRAARTGSKRLVLIGATQTEAVGHDAVQAVGFVA